MAESSSIPMKLSLFAKFTGINIISGENGHSQCTLEVTERILSLHMTAHGGAISTLVDVGMGVALSSGINRDELLKTVQLQVNYFTAASSGLLICESRIVNQGKRIATLESEVRNDGNLVAKATGTYYIYKAKGDFRYKT